MKKNSAKALASAPWAKRFSLALGVMLVLYALTSLVPSAWLWGHPWLQSLLCRFWLCPNDSLVESAYRQIWYGGTSGLAAGTELLRKSVALDPASAYRWCDLGEALLESGQRLQARHCFQRALDLGPNSPPILLRAANFHFRLGENQEVLRNMHRILAITPEYDQLIFSYYSKVEVPMEDILESGIPQQRRAAQSYFRYLLPSGTLAAVQTAWNWTRSHALSDDPLAADYVGFLVNSRHYDAAAAAWSQHVGDRAAGYLQTDYLFNGGFEFESTGALFDWRTERAEGVEVQRDRTFCHGGSWSLEIRFDGSHNLAYNHVRQRAFIRPGWYRLVTYVRTADITTDQGIGFRIIDVDTPARLDARTATMIGTRDWTRLEAAFQAKQPTALIELQVVRQPSIKFDNRIAGTAWIDDVRLLPVARPTLPPSGQRVEAPILGIE